MKRLTLPLVLGLSTAFSAYAQDQKMKSPEEIAIDMVNKMESELKLEPHQTFYVDSVLTHDYREWMDAMEKLQKAGVQEASVYSAVKEEWSVKIDSALFKILTPEQFIGYQKMTGTYKKSKKDKKAGKN